MNDEKTGGPWTAGFLLTALSSADVKKYWQNVQKQSAFLLTMLCALYKTEKSKKGIDIKIVYDILSLKIIYDLSYMK